MHGHGQVDSIHLGTGSGVQLLQKSRRLGDLSEHKLSLGYAVFVVVQYGDIML